MIVAPEFLDHWKTRLLVDELQGDELAPLYVLRIWAHCQVKKTQKLGRVSAGALKSICRYAGSHEVLWLALQNSGFIEVKNEQVEVHQWQKYNQGLINSWNNGRKGGRPKKPRDNPRGTHGVPMANPNVTDKIGLDEMRLEGIDPPPAAPGEADVPEVLRPIWADWLKHRAERHLAAYKPMGVKKQVAALVAMGADRARAAVDYSIRQNYQGIYEEKHGGKNGSTTDTRPNSRRYASTDDYSGIKSHGVAPPT